MKLEGKVSIVTGGGSGIGRATALLFASEGAKVVVADISDDAAAQTASMVNENGGSATAISANVSQSDQVQAMVGTAVNEYGKLDILVNNAGAAPINWPIADYEEEAWDRLMAVNMKGVFLCSKYAIPEMLKGGSGSIINIASLGGLRPLWGGGAYNVAKAGVVHLTKQTALEYARKNIRVNCITPGITDTPMAQSFGDISAKATGMSAEEALQKLINMALVITPMKRMGRPEELASAVLFLASEDASFITGAILPVDGGGSVG